MPLFFNGCNAAIASFNSTVVCTNSFAGVESMFEGGGELCIVIRLSIPLSHIVKMKKCSRHQACLKRRLALRFLPVFVHPTLQNAFPFQASSRLEPVQLHYAIRVPLKFGRHCPF